jgi:hypothetical protein
MDLVYHFHVSLNGWQIEGLEIFYLDGNYLGKVMVIAILPFNERLPDEGVSVSCQDNFKNNMDMF